LFAAPCRFGWGTMTSRRILRINDQLREEVAEMLRELKDPELEKLITITEVDTSPDLANAKVFVSTLGDEADIQRTIARLQRAAGYIRREIAHRLNLRKMPLLEFKADVSLIRGARVTRLLHEQEQQRET
jgi:ribosome-binding factor A